MLNVTISRDAPTALFQFMDYFKGFEQVKAVRTLFGDDTEKVLRELKIEFYSSRRWYMGVNDVDGNIMISVYYLKHGDERYIYLDIIHELFHIKQYKEGKDLFDDRFEYVDRPTEIEAYQATVVEAKRIGMSDAEIIQYLKTERMTDDDHRKLAKALNLQHP